MIWILKLINLLGKIIVNLVVLAGRRPAAGRGAAAGRGGPGPSGAAAAGRGEPAGAAAGWGGPAGAAAGWGGPAGAAAGWGGPCLRRAGAQSSGAGGACAPPAQPKGSFRPAAPYPRVWPLPRSRG
jgi:hypothetical protein